jgi:flagellar motor switch protein FliN
VNMKDTTQPQLIHYLETALGQAIGNMTGRSISVTLDQSAKDPPPLKNAITWQQSFSVASGSVPEGPSFRISAGRDLWAAVGRITLEAAGIDEVTDEDCRSTWQEILNQTAAGVAVAMTAELAREVAATKGAEIEAEAPGPPWLTFSISDGSDRGWSFQASWSGELASPGTPAPEEARSPGAGNGAGSKTFDLLLDVALPVVVSFGRTSLQIREVLKLNTGSIVELDRFVSDPVEVIVNDCVIARGEVVVVDGNYGVRVSQLASREDRLRSGIAETSHKGGRV